MDAKILNDKLLKVLNKLIFFNRQDGERNLEQEYYSLAYVT